MPAQIRIDQVTPGAGVAGRSRHDLIPQEIITLTATDPAPGVGITYAWEIIDKRGSSAVLSAPTGQSVTIGPFTAITRPSTFLIELVVTTPTGVTRTRRLASVRTLNAGLRVPAFPETAPDAAKLDLNTPDLATDNAIYANRSGLGTQQNWAGWSEWAWEIVQAVESSIGSSGPPSGSAGGDLRLTYPNPQVDGLYGVALDVSASSPSTGQALVFDGTNYKPTAVGAGKDYASIVVGNAPAGDTSGMCDFLDPGDGTGIELALAAAATSGGDIVLRAGDYDLVSGGIETPIVIPDNITIRGLSKTSTRILARMAPGASESMAVFTVVGELRDIGIYVDAPGSSNNGAETGFVNVVGGTCTNVVMTFANIISGEHTDFAPIVAAFEYTDRASLINCDVMNAPSFVWSGGTDHFIGFNGVASSSDDIMKPFKVLNCTCYSSSAIRGADTAFKVGYGPGHIDAPAAANTRLIALHFAFGAFGVTVSQVNFRWSFADTVGRRAVVFGEVSGGSGEQTVQGCEVTGGYCDIGMYSSDNGTPCVLFRSGSDGSILNNKFHGVTCRGWNNGAELDGILGTVAFNSIQFNYIEFYNSAVLQDSDTGTVFDNNIVNDVEP